MPQLYQNQKSSENQTDNGQVEDQAAASANQPPPPPNQSPATQSNQPPLDQSSNQPPPQPENNQTTGPQPNPPPESQNTPPPIKKSPFRFLIPFLLFLLVVGGIIFAVTRFSDFFGGAEPTPEEPVTITYWGLWEPDAVMQPVIKTFQSQNPHINVAYEQQSPEDYRERLQNNLQSGNGPDIFRYHVTWVPMLLDQLTPVPESVYAPQEFRQTFYPTAVNWLQTPQGFMGIPLMYDGLGLYFNQDIFDENGLTPPTTWDELTRIAIRLTVKNPDGQIQQSGVALGTTSNVDHWSDLLGLLMLQNGTTPANPNNVAGQGALQFYTMFNTTHQVWDDTLPPSTHAFASQRAVMMFGPTWRAHQVRELNQELNFAIAPIPQLPQTQETNWASFWVEGVSQNTSNTKRQAAWQFLQYLSSQEGLREFYTQASQEREFGEPFSRIDMGSELETDPFVGSIIQGAPTAKTWFLNSDTHDNGLNDQIIDYFQDAVNAVNEGESPEDALTTVEQGINQILSRYNLSQ